MKAGAIHGDAASDITDPVSMYKWLILLLGIDRSCYKKNDDDQ